MTDDPTLPYSTAKGYVQSAFLMMTNPIRYRSTSDVTFFLSFQMLCGFAVELYLKAFLLHKGFPEPQLRSRELGHNLTGLYALCVDRGLSLPNVNPLIELLDKHHKTFEFRYPKPEGMFGAPNLPMTFSLLSLLDNAVDVAIGASASHGKTPGGAWTFPPEFSPWRLD